VQTVLWHPQDAWLLASGSFDQTVRMVDCRTASSLGHVSIPSDMESMAWDPFRPEHLFCALEDGSVACIDARCLGAQLSSGGVTARPAGDRALVGHFKAHEETATSISFSASVPGLCATSSVDQTVRIWDMHRVGSDGAATLVSYKTQNVGKLFALDFCRDEPFMMVSGGDAGIVSVWDCDEQKAIKEYFEGRDVMPVPSEYVFQNEAVAASDGMEEVPPADTLANSSGTDGLVKKKKKNKKNKKL
ncbi:unnamed protein product, partial [Symbiodinium microadriaticum]